MSLEHDKRVCVYPAYLNSKYTVAQGRRIAKDTACEEPWLPEMHAACQALQVPAEMEQKSYPRDFYLRGRLRVQLYQPGGSTPVNPKIPTRHALFLAISEVLRTDTSRLKRRAAAQAKVAEAQRAAAQGGAGPSDAGDKEKKEKGKGKKKGRK